MTDFIDNLLTSMSSKFNEQKEVGPINLNEDKTLKWRGLHNNQYAAVKKRKDGRKVAVLDTPENALLAGENSGGSSIEKIVGSEPREEVSIDSSENNDESKPNRRILRRKLHEEIAEDATKRSSRGKKRQSSAEAMSGQPPAPEKIEKPNEDIAIAETKAPVGKRRGRGRKIVATIDQLPSIEPSAIVVERSKSPNVKAEEIPSVQIDTPENSEQPRLRRSERTLHGSTSTEQKESCDSFETKAEEEAAESPAATPAARSASSIRNCELMMKFRKKSPEERKSIVNETEAIVMDVVDVDQQIPKTSPEATGLKAASQIETKETIKNEEEGGGSPSADTPVPAILEVDAQPKPISKDEEPMVTAEPLIHTPKKRGRKPGTKLSPKIDVKTDLQIATRSSRVKKSPRLNSDESSFTYTLSKKDKTLNEQAPPQQRLSRRIKPTPKILANEELRQGFELQNNARLSLSSEHLDNDLERSPKQDIASRRGSTNKPESEIVTATANGGDKEDRKSTSPNLNNVFPVSAVADPIAHSEILRPPRRPCPDPEEFLNEIKMAKINLHRSPEDNKKLNLKQKKRLSKLKEKHLHKLGLQKATKAAHAHSSSDSNAESDDAEEFVPAKRINVGRPSVTLRVRGQKDIVIYDKHILPLKNKEKQQKKRQQPTPSGQTSDFPMVTIAGSAFRNPEISLISSTKHKVPAIMSGQNVGKTASNAETASGNDDQTICLCAKSSKYYTKKTEDTFCAAVDQIETQKVGCCNEIEATLPNLVRPSVRVSYMVLCDSHRRRLLSHNCCAGCGVFCTQGRFILCPQNHFFHRDCATKFILNAPFDPDRPHFTYPTLVLKCPHCGIDAPEDESTITMRCGSAPVFMPSQRNNPKLAKMSIGTANSNRGQKGREQSFLLNIGKIVPDYVVAILVRAQNSVPFADGHKFTTKDVFCAVNNNDVERMADIIASGFDITTPLKEFHYGTCLHLVSNFGSITMAYLILSRVSSPEFVNRLDKELRSAVMCSVVGGKNEILKLLLQCGADMTLKGPDGMTALHLAAKTGNLSATKLMLNSCRDTASIYKLEKFLNTTDDGGWTSMVWASELGNSEMVSAFLSCGADPNVCDAENNTALHWATLSENIETVMLLLQAGCNLGVQNVNGDTPLHISCRNENTNISLFLLANGASLEVTNNADEAPYDCIPDENGSCGRAIFFNLQIRSIAGFPKYTVVCQDISNGRELYPIKIIRRSNPRSSKNDSQPEFEFNDQIIPDFKYITKTILYQNSTQIDRRISQMRICSCLDNCTTQNCQCGEISIQNWYTSEGRLNADFNFLDPAMIFECNDVCGCNRLLCKNRVVQNGTKIPLQVFECEDKVKGLGVQALAKIPRGTFVTEYTGEILTDSEADRRTDDSYFFDLGASEHCIDANFYGNVSRFFNHSCEPNIVPIRVYYEHQDLRFPKIAFFSSRDIEPDEEITFDYGEKFWIVKYRTFTCHCGKAACRYSDDTITNTLEEYNQRNSTDDS